MKSPAAVRRSQRGLLSGLLPLPRHVLDGLIPFRPRLLLERVALRLRRPVQPVVVAPLVLGLALLRRAGAGAPGWDQGWYRWG